MRSLRHAKDNADYLGAGAELEVQPRTKPTGGSKASSSCYVDEHGRLSQPTYAPKNALRSGSRGRPVIITATLASLIIVGSGIAYGYYAIFSNSIETNGPPPIVKAETGPIRIQPGEAGRTLFPHKNKIDKIEARLSPSAEKSKPAGEAKTKGHPGSKEATAVTTITFDSHGRMVVSETTQPAVRSRPTLAAAEPTSRQPSPATTSQQLPGTIVMGGNGFNAPPTPSPEARTAQFTPRSEPTMRKPKTVTAKPDAAREPVQVSPVPLRPDAERVTTNTAPRPKQPRVASVSPRQATPTPQSSATARRYVAVVATKSSRLEALKTFIELQTRYADILGRTSPDVQIADLSARNMGIKYRTIIGPPGPIKAAYQVCSRLRAAAYRGCWVKAY